MAACLGALLTTWVTFVPCSLFILLGAPYVERLRGNRSLSAALTGIAAAVVGVIANLAVYFSLHTLFRASSEHTWGLIRLQLPDLHTVRPTSVLTTAAALLLIVTLRWSGLRTLGAGAALGMAAGLLHLT